MKSLNLKLPRGKKSGLTLVEMLISMVVLTIAIGSSIAVMGQSLRMIDSSNAHMASVQALRIGYEQLRGGAHILSTNVYDGKRGTRDINGKTIKYLWTRLGGAQDKTWELTMSMEYESMGRSVSNQMTSVISEAAHQ